MVNPRIKSLSAYKTERTSARVKLSSNELSIEFPGDVRKRIAEVLSELPFNRYPDPQVQELKEVVAQRFGVRTENLMLGNGSDELIYYLSVAIGDQNRGIFYPVPTFSMYGISAQVFGRERVEIRLNSFFDIDLEESLRLVQEKKPALAYFSYPNNPTGNLFSEKSIVSIRSQGVFTVLDEAYFHYSKRTFLKDALEREDTVVLRTLSKIGMAGLRVGIMIGKEEVIKDIEKIRLPFNITYPSQVIARLMLTEFYPLIEEEVERVIRERERVYSALLSMEGVEPFPSSANFILFRTYIPADLLHKKLIEKGVLVRNFSYMEGLEGCLRVSIGKPEENDAFLEALEGVLKEMA
ncbi:MAG: histidinol-phosphate transaminase [Acidobacteria bacterium]|jgi:histidinol-phosphate aminotransferase|nr:MAG: histidinol-phosphate transaminase [Acidobacteriota bacterium]